MGLGGLTRDSIVGLNNLVKDDDGDAFDQGPRLGRRLSGSWNKGSNNKDEFLFLLDEPPSEDAQPAAQSTFETSLNDGLAAMTITTPQTPQSPASLPYSKVSATNSRSLDSYRGTDSKSDASSNSETGYYQGFQYEGYSDYYADSFDYGEYTEERGGESNEDNILCCLFPWLSQMKPKDTESKDDGVLSEQKAAASTSSVIEGNVAAIVTSVPPLSPAKDSGYPPQEEAHRPDKTIAANVSQPQVKPQAHEKPISRQLQASGVAASAAASTASPTSVVSSCSPDSKANGDIKSTEKKGGGSPVTKKGILKKRTAVKPTKLTSSKQAADASSPTKQRFLFPSYDPKVEAKEKNKVNFIPMARVLTIASRKDFPLSQKCQVWWQKSDYDEFKKTGRIISKAMECGGSEIWLASGNAWGKSQNRQNANNHRVKSEGSDTEEYNKALSKYVGEEKKDDDASDDVGTKWWCKFGHSRRGIEHIASSAEGKARQQSVLLSIRMTLEEQRRQRASRTKDPNKLRNVSMQYTSWARDLALAAGTADAEAVSSNFNQAAKSRAHHFAKQLRVDTDSLHTLSQLDIGGGVAMAVTSQILDANTHYGSMLDRTASLTDRTLKDVHEGSEASLSKRAKGYIPGSNSEISSAAVLRGMGNVQPKAVRV